MRVLILGVVATLALSAGAASAQEAVYPRHGYAPYGYRYSGYAYGYHHRPLVDAMRVFGADLICP